MAPQRLTTSVTIKEGDTRREETKRMINTGLYPVTEKVVFFILIVYGIMVFNLILWGIGIFMDLLIPFLPFAFALGFTDKGLRVLKIMILEETVIATTSLWIVLLPTVVFLYSGFRKSQHTQQFMALDIASVSLGYFQHLVELRQQVSWLPSIINKVILAGHFTVSLVHLFYTFDNPVRKFRKILEGCFHTADKIGQKNRTTKRTLDKHIKKGAAKRKRR
jgi:hypothetical protein